MKATITSKGQVTIPKPVRDFLNVGKSDKIEFSITESGKVYIEVPQSSIVQYAGMLAPYGSDRALTPEEMDRVIQEELNRKVNL